jgi:hypothetical protein
MPTRRRTRQPKINVELPDMDVEEDDPPPEYRRRVPMGYRGPERRGEGDPLSGRRVVAIPLTWAISLIGSVVAGVFIGGYNWASALREIENMRSEVRTVRESVRIEGQRFSELDKSMAVLQKQLEIESAVRQSKPTTATIIEAPLRRE